MGQFSVSGLEPWTVQRILGFFNRAYAAKDLTEGVLKDDPGTGTGKYVIGEVVAQRILDRRNVLPGRRFTSISQLNGIQGMGTDKFHDLVYTFRAPAAVAFKEAMYAGVIGENWFLENYTTRWDNRQDFLELVDDATRFQNWLATETGHLATTKYGFPFSAADAHRRLSNSFRVDYESGHLGAYALAFWLYRFDQDNWFRFDRVLQETSMYLDFMPYVHDRAELRLYVGFENRDFLARAVTVSDLPVVVNYGEQAVTIWTGQLND